MPGPFTLTVGVPLFLVIEPPFKFKNPLYSTFADAFAEVIVVSSNWTDELALTQICLLCEPVWVIVELLNSAELERPTAIVSSSPAWLTVTLSNFIVPLSSK